MVVPFEVIMSRRKDEIKNKKREGGFDLSSVPHCKLKEYNALSDPNMRHYFENKKIQQLLYSSGQIDRHGRIIDPAKNKSKVNILEREFKEAEKIEELRLRDEMELRYRVQRKRFADLENTRRAAILMKVKQDRDLSKEIIKTIKAATAYSPTKTGNSSRRFSAESGGRSNTTLSNSAQNALNPSGFFVTDDSEYDY